MHLWKMALMVALPMMASVGTVSKDAHAATCDSLSCSGTVREISVFRNGHSLGALVRLDTDTRPTGTNCSLSSGTSWVVEPGNSEVIRSLTAAHLAEKTVKLRAVSNTGTCTVDYVTVY